MLYARIKGVSEDLLAGVAGDKLKQMDLETFRNTKVGDGRFSLQRRYRTAEAESGFGLILSIHICGGCFKIAAVLQAPFPIYRKQSCSPSHA